MRLSSIIVSIAAFIALLAADGLHVRPPLSALPSERDRSPIALALTPDSRWAVTANATSDSASLVDLQLGAVVNEVSVGKRPFGIATSPDGGHALVTNWLSNDVTVLKVSPPALTVERTIPVGDEPRGVAFSKDGNRAFVALAGEDSVVAVDLKSGKVADRLEVGTEPWHLALTPDGKRLVVGCTRSQELSVIDLAAWKVTESFKLRGHNVRQVAVAPDGGWAYVPHIAERGRPVTRDNIDQGWVIGSRLARAPLAESGPRESISLDPRGKAVGDVDGVAISPDGNTFALTAGGTHELLLLRQPLPFVAFGGPGDHIEKDLLEDSHRFRRVALGGRPIGVKFTSDGRKVIVSNYLSNSVQVIDAESAQIVKTISVHGPAEPTLARHGEAIFYDAERSFNQWYSCNTCHSEGHTNGATFDTFADGSYGTPKKTLSLRGVSRTGPWTWHGWQKELRSVVRDSMTKSMQGKEPTDVDLDALLAFLGTLEFRPSLPLTESARRGAEVFKAKGCDACHAAPDYTTPAIYVVGLESELDVYKGFNPPSLRNVRNRAPYLHTGVVRGLSQLLSQVHRPSQLSNKPDCTPQELADLVAFLKTL